LISGSSYVFNSLLPSPSIYGESIVVVCGFGGAGGAERLMGGTSSTAKRRTGSAMRANKENTSGKKNRNLPKHMGKRVGGTITAQVSGRRYIRVGMRGKGDIRLISPENTWQRQIRFSLITCPRPSQHWNCAVVSLAFVK